MSKPESASPTPLFTLLQERKKRRNHSSELRKTPLWNPKSLNLKIVPGIYCFKEVAGSTRKASPTSEGTGARSGTRNQAFLRASWDIPRRASPSPRSLGVVGDVAPLEETVETDSERGD
ncbi:hypothetical protein Taro_040317 [Colocasia esculenta]|uniref:Uncharacterized protein n=1 Tax=Colocasia esculenta TaxID=4460 RepID=A0A843WIR2_COLES|nr:hypothetical protein [Colocasia esculenta]